MITPVPSKAKRTALLRISGDLSVEIRKDQRGSDSCRYLLDQTLIDEWID